MAHQTDAPSKCWTRPELVRLGRLREGSTMPKQLGLGDLEEGQGSRPQGSPKV